MLEFGIVSSDHRDDLYAELLLNDVQWGELTLRDDKKAVNIIIYPNGEGSNLQFCYDEFMELLYKARKRLLEVEDI